MCSPRAVKCGYSLLRGHVLCVATRTGLAQHLCDAPSHACLFCCDPFLVSICKLAICGWLILPGKTSSPGWNPEGLLCPFQFRTPSSAASCSELHLAEKDVIPGIDISDPKISIYWMASCLAGHIIGSSLWAVGPFIYAMLKLSVMPCSNIQSCHAQTFSYAMLKHLVMSCSDIRAALLLPCCLVTAAAFMCRPCLEPFGLQLHNKRRGASHQKGHQHTSNFTPPPAPPPFGHGDRGQPSQNQCFAGKTGHRPCSDAACSLEASFPVWHSLLHVVFIYAASPQLMCK